MAAVTSRRAPDWDALAPVWHCLEAGGLDRAVLRAVLPSLAAPLLYVGGGRGVFPSQLARWLAPGTVAVVDSSLEMARRAWREFGLTYACADVRAMPWASGSFASTLCATGVLDYLDASGRVNALRELCRVTTAGGPVLVATFDGAGPVDGDALESWWHRGEHAGPRDGVALAFDGVARAVGDREAGFSLLRRSLPTHGGSPGAGLPQACAGLGVTALPVHSGGGVTVWGLVAGAGTGEETVSR